MRTYTLDPQAAKSAGMNGRIEESGKYVGTFTRAEVVKSRKGTEGVEFTFRSDDGRTADYLTCWTYNADGKELFGYKILMAVMTVLRAKTIQPTQVQATDRDGNPRDAMGFPALLNKPVGLVLQREEYEKNDGTVGSKFNILVPFDASSGLAAGEILDRKTSAEYVDRIVSTLRDKPLTPRKDSGYGQYASSGHPSLQPKTGNGGTGLADLDDDIPF